LPPLKKNGFYLKKKKKKKKTGVGYFMEKAETANKRKRLIL